MRKKERIRQAVQNLRERFQKAGMPIDDVTLDFGRDIARDHRYQEILKIKPQQLVALSISAGLFVALEENSHLPQHQWDRMLDEFMQKLPNMVRSDLRRSMRAAFKDLPKRLSTGRPEALSTPSKRKQACDLVSKYHREGDSMRTAYMKAAEKMNCSPRTVQRAWQQRDGS
jgi:hypothetical protein